MYGGGVKIEVPNARYGKLRRVRLGRWMNGGS